MFSELLSGLGLGVLEVVKTSAPLLVTGALMKHGGRLSRRIPNDLIPVANGVIGVVAGVATTGDAKVGAQMGILAATGATGMHQLLKITTRSLLEKHLPAGLTEKVSSNGKLSI